jgi:hypothetical protein
LGCRLIEEKKSGRGKRGKYSVFAPLEGGENASYINRVGASALYGGSVFGYQVTTFKVKVQRFLRYG